MFGLSVFHPRRQNIIDVVHIVEYILRDREYRNLGMCPSEFPLHIDKRFHGELHPTYRNQNKTKDIVDNGNVHRS